MTLVPFEYWLIMIGSLSLLYFVLYKHDKGVEDSIEKIQKKIDYTIIVLKKRKYTTFTIVYKNGKREVATVKNHGKYFEMLAKYVR